MSLKGQDLISLCALAAQNEDLIVNVGKFALNMALSPNHAALDIAKGIAGIVFTRLASKSQGRSLTPTNSRHSSRRVSVCDFIQNEMNKDQQQKLIDRMSNVLDNKKQSSYGELLSMILNNSNVRNKIVGELKRFLEGENMSCSKTKRGSSRCVYDDDDDDDDDDEDDYYDAPCCSSRSKSCSKY